jgi:hypothetical protein
MSLGGQIFGLRATNLLPAFTLPSRRNGTSGLTAFAWGFVTRYRSATVAGSHGLPWIRLGKELVKVWVKDWKGQSHDTRIPGDFEGAPVVYVYDYVYAKLGLEFSRGKSLKLPA